MKTGTTGRWNSRARCGFRSVLALVVAAALAVGNLPAAPVSAGEEAEEGVRYYRNGGEMFRLDYGAALREGAAVLRGGGEFTVRVSRALQGTLHDDSGWRQGGFVLGAAKGTTAFADLGTDIGRALGATGLDARRAARWEEVVEWTLTSTAESVTSTFRVGPDWMSLTLPRQVVETGAQVLPADAVVTVEANGLAARLDGAALNRWRADTACSSARVPAREARALRAMGDGFVDMARFMNRVGGYLAMERRARIMDALGLGAGEDDAVDASCASDCFACAGSLLAGIGAYVALIAACGGALVTGGSTALLCIAAFIGVQAGHLLVFGSCSRCIGCVTQPECPCEGEPVCDCA